MSSTPEEVKSTARKAWSAVSYDALGALLLPAAVRLVDACAISAGQEILDVAAGHGNLAITAAAEGAAVTASDITPAMVERGKARSAEEGVEIDWVEADVEQLPFEDASFDCVASVFGAMLAPQPERVAAELFRVVRPGNTVGMANWVPDGFIARLLEAREQFLSRPDWMSSPTLWGDPDVVAERFDGLAGSLTTERDSLRCEFDSPEEMADWFSRNAGNEALARERLGEAVYGEMRESMLGLIGEFGGVAGEPVAIDCEYLVVVARRRG